MSKIKRALISVTNKSGIVEFAKFLTEKNVELLSTGGTAALLREHNIPVKEVAEHTGSPEILDGRVKTLHPKIHGGLLAKRSDEKHQKQMQDNQILSIDMVVVNLYAFEDTVAKADCTLEDAIENIDIGGPSMLRSAAKNHQDVVVVVDPGDYKCLMDEWNQSGEISLQTKRALALKVFEKTAAYDDAIVGYLKNQLSQEILNQVQDDSSSVSVIPDPIRNLPDKASFQFQKIQDLRYGENPHQKAAFYSDNSQSGLANAKQLQGKALSFNNILDAESAYRCCQEIENTACVIVKHNNPCGVAQAETLSESFLKARSCDPVSSFGGIVALNQEVDEKTAAIMAETFFEVILAPKFSNAALKIFERKKNLRLLELPDFSKPNSNSLEIRCVSGGALVQEIDNQMIDIRQAKVVTKREPTEEEWQALDFNWRVCKHVKSNAIVFGNAHQTLGIGAGQMSRVDSVKLAALKAEESFKGKNILQGSVIASDAFFPFRDGLDFAAKQGITAVIQPGGSVRDEEVIESANENNIAMVFTGMRHFRH